ncbi:MAG TPA: xanthine dehydrogenase subunit D [Acidimicrobiales bacterium]|jgi:xanthine dehydrogenase D subunit|nr:xanthine dehydrogenase subunit D [Acidimicrobiales bacterium]
MTAVTETIVQAPAGRIGENASRPDGGPKVRGEFAFSGDLWAEGMLWGRTLRSPYPSARILSIDVSPALRIPGVRAVVTASDLPAAVNYGLEWRDQPVFATDVVRYVGEPVAAVAADHPETARRACAAIEVRYELLEPILDPALAEAAPPIHPDGNVFRHLVIRRGDATERGPIVVQGIYEVGMQDQAFMGPEAGLAVPAEDGGIDLIVSTQWLHNDQTQVAECLGLPPDKVRLSLGGVGGAFGAREDVSLQIHACLLAQRSGRPVKIVYSREESFLGHVHRHPGRIWMRHSAEADGRIVSFEARILLDGGAYRSSSYHVVANAACFSAGPYKVDNADVEAMAVRTNNPSCGAMRGFGAVQVCFAHEAQMDKLAAACDLDPVELRLRNALATGDALLTGQKIEGALPVAECIRQAAALPLPPDPSWTDPMTRPGGAGRTSDAGHIRRGVGFAVGFKNLMYAEGYMDGSAARCRLVDGLATVTCAAAEVGQGFVTVAQQIARTVLGVDDVLLAPADTSIGSAGSSSASRQTWMSGGAVEKACRAVRTALLGHVAEIHGVAPATLDIVDGRIVGDGLDVPVAQAAPGVVFEQEVEYHHRLTHPLDADGQGDAHVSLVCAAHRAVVDVDPELGMVRVVQIVTGQDVGRALNPLQVIGQIEGGIAQGLGLATMEELTLRNGKILNPSFTDYLIPTALDMPDVAAALVEVPEPDAPFGAKGVGEPPTISSTPAIVAALRAATGKALPRVPVRPQDIALGS